MLFMRVLICLFLFCFTSLASEPAETKKTIQNSSSPLVDLNNSEYRIKLFEPDHKTYMWYFGGTINKDYDHFGKVIRLNGFTNLGIEF